MKSSLKSKIHLWALFGLPSLGTVPNFQRRQQKEIHCKGGEGVKRLMHTFLTSPATLIWNCQFPFRQAGGPTEDDHGIPFASDVELLVRSHSQGADQQISLPRMLVWSVGQWMTQETWNMKRYFMSKIKNTKYMNCTNDWYILSQMHSLWL